MDETFTPHNYKTLSKNKTLNKPKFSNGIVFLDFVDIFDILQAASCKLCVRKIHSQHISLQMEHFISSIVSASESRRASSLCSSFGDFKLSKFTVSRTPSLL